MHPHCRSSQSSPKPMPSIARTSDNEPSGFKCSPFGITVVECPCQSLIGRCRHINSNH
jgi:hypothetical protein